MTNKHFEAILAKNVIAKELGDINIDDLNGEYRANAISSINYIISQLKEIEKYIGQGNQPSIDSIIKD